MVGEGREGCTYPKIARKYGQNHPQKSGFGDRQVGAFSVFWLGDTGIPFIFS